VECRWRHREGLRGEWIGRVMAPSGFGRVRRRVRAGAGLLAISTVIQLVSMWLRPGPFEGTGSVAWLLVALGASTWLLVQPWRRRLMIFDVVLTTLGFALVALTLAFGQSNPNVGLTLVALLIGGLGLVLLSVAEAWAAVFAAILAVAAGITLYVGLASSIFGGAHLWGVLVTASSGAYDSYDFRLAALLLLGMAMVFAGVLCLTAVRGLARGQRRAWDRAMIGSLLLFVVTVPIVYVPVQGLLAAAQAWGAALNVIVLVGAWRRLEAGATVA
jgi:hypothetical protein